MFIENFETYIMYHVLARNALPLVRAGYQQAVVKLIKIVELEAQEDEQV